MAEAEDFEPYKVVKDVARKVGNFVGIKSSTSKDTSGPGPRRTDAEIREAKAMPKREIDTQNVRAYNRSIQNKPGAIKMIEPMPEQKFEKKEPYRKGVRKSSRSSSRR